MCVSVCECAAVGQHCRSTSAAGHCRIGVLLPPHWLFLSSLCSLSGNLLKEDGESMCCILFSRGGLSRRERGSAGGITEVQCMPVRRFVGPTVPASKITVGETGEQEKRRRRVGEETGWEVGSRARTEVQETSGECGSFLCRQCSIQPSEPACRRTADVPV